MEISLWEPLKNFPPLQLCVFLTSSCSFLHCNLSALPHLYCAPLIKILLCFQSSEEKAGCDFSIVQSSCWYRDLGKFHKTNGKNWGTSCFPDLGRGVWCCHRNCMLGFCSFGFKLQESFREEVGGKWGEMSHPHCLW